MRRKSSNPGLLGRLVRYSLFFIHSAKEVNTSLCTLKAVVYTEWPGRYTKYRNLHLPLDETEKASMKYRV